MFHVSYVYWTVHHLDSWINIDQLEVTCFIISLFTAQHVSNVSTSIFSSLRLIVDLFHVLYFSGSMCVGVTVWFGWGGVVSLCRLKQCFTTPSTPTHIVPEQHNPWNNSTNKAQATEDGCTNIRNMSSSKQWNSKASNIKLVYIYSTIMFHVWLTYSIIRD